MAWKDQKRPPRTERRNWRFPSEENINFAEETTAVQDLDILPEDLKLLPEAVQSGVDNWSSVDFYFPTNKYSIQAESSDTWYPTTIDFYALWIAPTISFYPNWDDSTLDFYPNWAGLTTSIDFYLWGDSTISFYSEWQKTTIDFYSEWQGSTINFYSVWLVEDEP